MSESNLHAHDSIGAEPHTTVDPEKWRGPFSERDKYGNPTGERYVRCRSCRRSVLVEDRNQLTHAEGCENA